PKVKGFDFTPLMHAAARGATNVVQRLLSNGAAVNMRESFHGATALTWAAACQSCGPDTVKALLAAGANPPAREAYGGAARAWALRQGNPEVIRLLAPSLPERNVPGSSLPAFSTTSPPSPRDAVARSLPLLQRAGPSFVANAPEGCVSCHHQSLPAMAIALA